ncbi:unnamed protein product [Spodoptera exigua]|nr:unnamed protein product [Spodoptera exigua]
MSFKNTALSRIPVTAPITICCPSPSNYMPNLTYTMSNNAQAPSYTQYHHPMRPPMRQFDYGGYLPLHSNPASGFWTSYLSMSMATQNFSPNVDQFDRSAFDDTNLITRLSATAQGVYGGAITSNASVSSTSYRNNEAERHHSIATSTTDIDRLPSPDESGQIDGFEESDVKFVGSQFFFIERQKSNGPPPYTYTVLRVSTRAEHRYSITSTVHVDRLLTLAERAQGSKPLMILTSATVSQQTPAASRRLRYRNIEADRHHRHQPIATSTTDIDKLPFHDDSGQGATASQLPRDTSSTLRKTVVKRHRSIASDGTSTTNVERLFSSVNERIQGATASQHPPVTSTNLRKSGVKRRRSIATNATSTTRVDGLLLSVTERKQVYKIYAKYTKSKIFFEYDLSSSSPERRLLVGKDLPICSPLRTTSPFINHFSEISIRTPLAYGEGATASQYSTDPSNSLRNRGAERRHSVLVKATSTAGSTKLSSFNKNIQDWYRVDSTASVSNLVANDNSDESLDSDHQDRETFISTMYHQLIQNLPDFQSNETLPSHPLHEIFAQTTTSPNVTTPTSTTSSSIALGGSGSFHDQDGYYSREDNIDSIQIERPYSGLSSEGAQSIDASVQRMQDPKKKKRDHPYIHPHQENRSQRYYDE